MSAAREEEATTASTSRSICSFFPAEGLGVEEHISHNYKEHSSVHSVPSASESKERPKTFGRLGFIHSTNQVWLLGRWRFGRWRSTDSLQIRIRIPRRYQQQQRRPRGHRRRVQRNERFSLPFLSLSLSRFFGTSDSRNLARSIVPFAGALALGPTVALVIRVPVPTGVAPPFEPLHRPAFMDTRCLDVELPLQSRVGIQVISSIQLGPVAPGPTGCAWAARAFDLHSNGWEQDGRTVTLAFAREDIALGRLGDTEYRRRYGRQNALARYNGLLMIAAKELAGAGRLRWGDSDIRPRATNGRGGGRAVLKNIFLAVRRRRRRWKIRLER